MAKPSFQRLGTSIDVPNVQALAASIANPADVPPRYVRTEAKADPVVSDGDSELPVIDFSRLLHHRFSKEEYAKLHHACADWGFFQLINHGVPDQVMEKIKADIVEFFKLPLEEKKAFAQLPNSLEGYGQAFVMSDDQKLDWADMLSLITRPLHSRNIDLWPAQPLTFRDSLSCYSMELKSVAGTLLEVMAKNLGVAPEEFSSIFQDQTQAVRFNYYPPCPRADEVLGLSPHTDGSGLTLLLQVNDVEGLHIRKRGNWFPVKPLPGALIANIGDIIEILSNGVYKSVEHQAIINVKEERLSIATFHGPREYSAVVGPLAEIVKGCNPKYVSMSYGEFMKAYLSTKLEGRRLMESLKL
uniref:Fe2OG dioxygenase domain-containing protein n=1 Tax=Musa acuminata subsp. malaccensis TaxID=214687 RepID=A0A804L437_MUSAM